LRLVKFLHNRFFARGSATAQHPTCKTACEKIFLNLKSLLKKAFVHGSTFVQLTSCKKHCEQFSYKLIQRKKPTTDFSLGAVQQHSTRPAKPPVKKFFSISKVC